MDRFPAQSSIFATSTHGLLHLILIWRRLWMHFWWYQVCRTWNFSIVEFREWFHQVLMLCKGLLSLDSVSAINVSIFLLGDRFLSFWKFSFYFLFTYLTHFDFKCTGNNLLEGPIPDSFFKLTNLKVLGLDDNLLESPISKFASLNQMQKLYLEGK